MGTMTITPLTATKLFRTKTNTGRPSTKLLAESIGLNASASLKYQSIDLTLFSTVNNETLELRIDSKTARLIAQYYEEYFA